MKLDFDLGKVTVTEFGVGRDDNGQTFTAMPVDGDVQTALQEMVRATWEAMERDEDGPSEYEPSERHRSTQYLTLSLQDDMAMSVRELHEAANLHLDGAALDEPKDVFCYFARLTDTKKRRVTALRRATHFKGVLKKRLIRFVSDSLKLIDDDVFKLDADFDLLVDSSNIHILRPSGFEFAGRLQQAILDAAPANVAAIAKDLAFVVLDGIETYASTHPRAARYLASIRGQKENKSIDSGLLRKVCRQTGVQVSESNGRLVIADGHEMGFLEVLDRRRYELELVKGSPERFKAASRKKIDG